MPADAETFFRKLSSGDLIGAKTELDAITRSPTETLARATTLKAHYLVAKDRADQAVRLLEGVIDANQDEEGRCLFELANLQFTLERWPDSLRLFLSYIEKKPKETYGSFSTSALFHACFLLASRSDSRFQSLYGDLPEDAREYILGGVRDKPFLLGLFADAQKRR